MENSLFGSEQPPSQGVMKVIARSNTFNSDISTESAATATNQPRRTFAANHSGRASGGKSFAQQLYASASATSPVEEGFDQASTPQSTQNRRLPAMSHTLPPDPASSRTNQPRIASPAYVTPPNRPATQASAMSSQSIVDASLLNSPQRRMQSFRPSQPQQRRTVHSAAPSSSPSLPQTAYRSPSGPAENSPQAQLSEGSSYANPSTWAQRFVASNSASTAPSSYPFTPTTSQVATVKTSGVHPPSVRYRPGVTRTASQGSESRGFGDSVVEGLDAAAAVDLADAALITGAFNANTGNDNPYKYPNDGSMPSDPRFGYDQEDVTGKGPEDDRIPLDQSYANTDRFKNEGGDLDGEYQQDRYTVNTSAYGDASFDPYALYSRDWNQDPVGLDDSGVDQQGPYTHDEVLQQQHGDEGQQPYLPDHEGANDLHNSLQDSYASDQAGYRDSDGRGGVQLDQFSAEQLDYDIDNGVPGVLQNPNFSQQPDLYGGTVHQHPHDATQPDLPVYDSGSPNLPLSFDPLGGNNSDQEPYVANNGGHTILNQPDDQQSGRDDQSYPHAPDQYQSEDNANPSPFRPSHFPDGNVHGTPYSAEQPVYDGVDSFSNNLRHDDGGETGSLQQDVPTNQYIDFHGLDTSKGSGQNVQFPQAHNLGPDDSFLGESDSAQEAFPAGYGPGEPDQYEDRGQDSWDSIGPEPGPDPVQDGSEAGQDGWNSPQLQEPDQSYHGGQYGWDQRGNGDTRNQGNNGNGGSALRPPLYSANQYEHGHQSSDQGDNRSATPAIENVIDELQQDLASSTSQGSLAQPSHHPQTGYAQQQPHQQLSPHGQQHPPGSTPPNHVQYSPRPPVHHPQQPPRPPTDYQQQLPRPPAHHPQQSPRPPANQQPPRPPANHPQPPRPPTNHPQQPPGPPANYQSSQPTTSHHQQPLRPSASNHPRPSAMQPTKHPAGNHHASTPGSSLTPTKPFQYDDNSGTPQVAQPQRPQRPAFSSQQVSTHGSSPRPTGPAQTPATQSLPQGLQQQLARPTPIQRPTIHTPGNTSQRPASGGGDVAHSQNPDQVSPPTHPAQPPARVPTSQLPGPGHSPDMQHQRSQSGHSSNLPQRLGSPGMPLSGQRRHSSQTPPGHSAEQSMRPSMLHHSGPGSSGRPPNELHRPQVTRPTQPPGAAAPHHAQPPPIPSATTTHQPAVSGESFLLAEVTSAVHVSGQTSVPHELPSPASAPRAQTNPQSGTNHRLHRPSAQHSSSEGSRRPPYTPQQLPPNASAAHHSSPPLAPAIHPFQHPVEPLRPIRPARHPSNIAQPQNHPQPPATHQPSDPPSQQTPPTPLNPPSNNTLLQSRPPQSSAHQSLDSSPQWPAVAISGPVAAGTTNPVSGMPSQRRPAGDSIARGQSSGHSTQQQQRRPSASTASAGPSPTPASTIPPSHQGGVDRSSGQSRRHPSASSSTVVPSSTSQQSELEDRSGPQNAPYNTSVQQPHVASKPGRLSRRHVSSFGSIKDPEPTNPPFQQPGISGLGRPPNQPHSASSSNVSSPSFAQYGIAAGSGQTLSHSWPQSLSPVSSIHHTVAMPPPRLPSQQSGISDVLGPQHAPFRQDSFQAQLTSMYQDPLNPNSLPQLQPQGSIGGFATQAQAQSQPAVSQMVQPTMSPMPFIMPAMMTPGQHPLQSANAYPVVSPSGQGGFQTPRAPAAHTIPTQPQRTTTQPQSGGIDAHKIGEYADTALKVGTAAFKLFRMAETLTGNDNNN